MILRNVADIFIRMYATDPIFQKIVVYKQSPNKVGQSNSWTVDFLYIIICIFIYVFLFYCYFHFLSTFKVLEKVFSKYWGGFH